VWVGAVAAANGTGVTLTSMQFTVDDVPMLDATEGQASWALDTAQSPEEQFPWDSAQVQNGLRHLKATVSDSNGHSSTVERIVLVDNQLPNPVAVVPTATLTPSTGLGTVGWVRTLDGSDYSNHYRVDVLQENPSGSWPTASIVTSGPIVREATFTVPTYAPFSRYQFAVTAYGPPPLSQVSDPGQTPYSQYYITRPKLTANYTIGALKSNGNYPVSNGITVSPPTFQTSGAVTYTLLRSLNPDMSDVPAGSNYTYSSTGGDSGHTWTYSSGSTTWTDAYETKTAANGRFAVLYYYRVQVGFTPAGDSPHPSTPAAGSASPLFSQIAGPQVTFTPGTYGLPSAW
jgi:hypothetical protein